MYINTLWGGRHYILVQMKCTKRPSTCAITIFYRLQPMYTKTVRVLGAHTIRQCTNSVFYQVEETRCLLYSIWKEQYTLKARYRLILQIPQSLQKVLFRNFYAVIRAIIVIIEEFSNCKKWSYNDFEQSFQWCFLQFRNHIPIIL